ncbi:MAG: excinuclease ABC subunit UvrA [Oscillospiraceae bacterium]|jgi:excinuclease ABC subunit A|nr:excinuclease ABC subunit UvrA [Oscillospiraceae bacterium]
MRDTISVRGAREHNLKNIDVDIPRDKLVVLTGLSGSGKSSLAFDTIYAEGRRRYVESLSAYARQFLGQMEKPDVDYIEGLSPAISIDQKSSSRNPRSTVGTVTEIYDYLRLLWARVGVPHCPRCGLEITRRTTDQITDRLLELPEGTRLTLLAPVARARKGEFHKTFDDARRGGFARARVDGSLYDLSEEIALDKNKKHNIEIVIDRLAVRREDRARVADSVETAAKLSGGLVISSLADGNETLYSLNYACADCGVSMEELAPRMFSFNNPHGACPKCAGLGSRLRADPDRVLPDKSLSLLQGAVAASGWGTTEPGSVAYMYFTAICEHFGCDINLPAERLPEGALDFLLRGSRGEKLTLRYRKAAGSMGFYRRPFEGVLANLERRHRDSASESVKRDIEEYMSAVPCADCKGLRLKKETLAVTVGGLSIADYAAKSVAAALAFLDTLTLTEKESAIAAVILKEIRERLGFLRSVGLEYLTLSRHSASLSGGEAQRIRLATQIGSSLMGVLYILDEPSIGLHQRDNEKLLATLCRLRDLGNTLLVVEHDEDTIRAADYIVDIGPGAGLTGGEVVAAGRLPAILAAERSVTGQYLRGEKFIPVPRERRKGGGKKLTVKGARENNLKNLNISLPLGTFVCVTGVSGSGKSSLVNEIIHKALAFRLHGAHARPGAHDRIDGAEYLDKVIAIDQGPIGRTPRSNPATYTGLFGEIRDLFAATSDARERGYGPGRFSFNVKGGRCEACGGDGLIKIEMHFLPDVYVTCDVCKGRRYNRETLEVRFKGVNIHEALDMTASEAAAFFSSVPKLARKLDTLCGVGLGYIKIGQPSTTLSGGEAQRVKLATELQRRSTGSTIYILDEPTTGLHAADVHKLVEVLGRLADAGNTVLVIEHNLDVIKTADYIIDLGPEGGEGGGRLLACGTPEQVAENPASHTGLYLRKALTRGGMEGATPRGR